MEMIIVILFHLGLIVSPTEGNAEVFLDQNQNEVNFNIKEKEQGKLPFIVVMDEDSL